RPDARRTVERVDLDPGVVRERGQAGPARTCPGLDASVRLERLAGLLRVVVDAEIVEAHELAALQRQQLPQLGQLVGRMSGDDQSRTVRHLDRPWIARRSNPEGDGRIAARSRRRLPAAGTNGWITRRSNRRISERRTDRWIATGSRCRLSGGK